MANSVAERVIAGWAVACSPRRPPGLTMRAFWGRGHIDGRIDAGAVEPDQPGLTGLRWGPTAEQALRGQVQWAGPGAATAANAAVSASGAMVTRSGLLGASASGSPGSWSAAGR